MRCLIVKIVPLQVGLVVDGGAGLSQNGIGGVGGVRCYSGDSAGECLMVTCLVWLFGFDHSVGDRLLLERNQ